MDKMIPVLFSLKELLTLSNFLHNVESADGEHPVLLSKEMEALWQKVISYVELIKYRDKQEFTPDNPLTPL